MPKDNLLFKLDNLEYQFHYLSNTLDTFQPRLNQTKKLYNAKGRKTSQKIEKLLNEITLDDINKKCNEMRLTIFNGKVYTIEKNLNKSLLKRLSQLKNKDNVLKHCKSLNEFVNYIVMSKVIKFAISKIIGNKQTNNMENVPEWFQDHKYLIAYNDKTNDLNPSRIWNDIVMKTEEGTKIVGNLMNDKKSQEILKTFENGMDVFLGINRDKNSKRQQETTKEKSKKQEKANDAEEEQEEDDDEEDIEENLDGERHYEGEGMEIDEDELLKQYEGVLAASDDEEEQENIGLDPTINYNEVTDEEPSEIESESESEDEQPAKKKAKLPELMTGYYSGEDSDSDMEEDKISRQQASNKIVKKNRRGQRARRKIWEQKYGKQANHVQKEYEQQKAEREQRQVDYEARVAKRAAKQAVYDKTNANLTELGERGSRSKNQAEAIKPVKVHEDHPSWVAKKLAEEKLKNAKFTGKKITFD
ncbi:bud site selection protein 22 [Monosporozyma servazzii]